MTLDEVIRLLAKNFPRGLSYLQEEVLRLAWEGYTYNEMAEILHYQDAYLKNIASQLWQELSLLLGEPISKANFCTKFKAYHPVLESLESEENAIASHESPYGLVPLTSPFYIERPPVEQLVKAEICKAGAMIRLQAPAQMGKSSLLLRIINYAESLNYQTVNIDLKEAEQAVLLGLTPFLRWFCSNLSLKLNLKPNLNEYWDQDTGSKLTCNWYLENHVLFQLNSPLVLIIHDIDQLLKYSRLAQDFLLLLRFWHEQAKQSDCWGKLRLVIVHTTAIYVPLDYDQSPFNIGLSINLPEFTLAQVQELAARHGLQWKDRQGRERAKALMGLVGGHPYLIRLALYHISYRVLSLEKLLLDATTPSSIYADYLRNYLIILQGQPELSQAWKEVVNSSQAVKLDTITAYKLESLGLLKLGEEGGVPRCDLYRSYFQQEIAKGSLDLTVESYLRQLEKDNHNLQYLSFIDKLTQIPNRRYFEQTFQQEWRRSFRQRSPLSLILCEIDDFSAYRNLYGQNLADTCLEKIAQAISNCLLRPSDFIARYGGEKFALLLSDTPIQGAIKVLERVQEEVRKLAIFSEDSSRAAKMLTLSFGMACTIPKEQESVAVMLEEAEGALYQSKQQKRDKITVSSRFHFSHDD